MKAIDRYLQQVRIGKAKKYIRKNDTLLDIGTADGVIFENLSGLIKSGTGIDPLLPDTVVNGMYTLLPGYFPEDSPTDKTFDIITMLAVLEHMPSENLTALATKCFQLLNVNGRIIITVPSAKVDHMLRILKWLKLIDGMSLEEHHGFNPADTLLIFPGKYFKLLKRQRFQLGLNNLFVFEKIINFRLPSSPGNCKNKNNN